MLEIVGEVVFFFMAIALSIVIIQWWRISWDRWRNRWH